MRKKFGLVTAMLTCSLFFSFVCFNKETVKLSAIDYQSENTDISYIKIKQQDASYAVCFYLSNSDYAGKSACTSIRGVSDLNFLSNISLDNCEASSPYTNERYLNVWNEVGSFDLRLNTSTAQIMNFVTDLKSITINQGCEFPSHAYGSSTSDVPLKYVVKRTLTYKNDGTGVFTYDPHQSEKYVPEGYTAIDTTVTQLSECNGTERFSFLRFVLSNSDYNGVASTTSINKYATELEKLKFHDHIYVNNVDLSTVEDHTSYSIETFINLFGVGPSFAFRTPGNNTGYYYKSGGVIYKTSDLTAYEVTVGAGCLFPSFRYLTGEISTPTCYRVTKTARFIWEKGGYVLLENYNEPEWISNEVVRVESHGTGVDSAIDFCLEQYDFPDTASDVVFNSEIRALTLSSRILIFKTDNSLISVSSERFANVWNKKGCFSIRKPSVEWSDISCVVVVAHLEFPTFGLYSSTENTRYVTNETRTFCSNGDGTFYLANNINASQFATNFLKDTDSICANYDGKTDNKAALTPVFASYSETYSKMMKSEKLIVKTSSDPLYVSMMARYNYLVNKYDLEDFINYVNNVSSSSSASYDDDFNFLPIIISSMSAITFAAFIVLKRKVKIK